MFILTLSSNNKAEIVSMLVNLAKRISKEKDLYGTIGDLFPIDGKEIIHYEYDVLPEQNFITMSDFLIFNLDHQTLAIN